MSRRSGTPTQTPESPGSSSSLPSRVVAVHWRDYKKGDVVERLERNAPEVAAAVRLAGDEVTRRVAGEIAHLFRVKDRFLKFLLAFAPPAPQPRPTHCALDWTRLEEAFSAVYDRRSDALHAGVPIPWPMWIRARESENGALEEHTGGVGLWSGGAYWPANETPMYLNTFAYIVRGALLGWWHSVVPTPKEVAAS